MLIIVLDLFWQLEVDVYLSTTGEMGSVIEHRAYEFQRWQTVVGWGSDYPGHLLPTDPGRYCTSLFVWQLLLFSSC